MEETISLERGKSSTLVSLLIYFMSLFTIPRIVRLRLDKI